MPIVDHEYPVALHVDLNSRKQAKAKGATWNSSKRRWEARNPVVLFKCSRWTDKRLGLLWRREWLDVPHDAIHQSRAKNYNARYDSKHQCWYDPYMSASESAAGLNPYRLRNRHQYSFTA
jgi:hypothetical protein